MKLYKLALSQEAPNVKDCMWIRPVAGGFALYMNEHGTWKPLKLMNDNGTVYTTDDTDIINDIVGTDEDEATDDTIKGVKAYVDSVIGTEEDDASDLTLYGLKALIESL